MSFSPIIPEDSRPPGNGEPPWARKRASSREPARPFLWASAGAALLGAIFSALSTSDFINHLDRQWHAVHCSFIPGMAPELGESGCRTVMLSPYSSLFRESFWGGMPIALWSLAVFAYLIARSLHFALKDNPTHRQSMFLLLAWCLPVLMSLIYGVVAAVQVGTMCKLCVGIYVASALGFTAAVMAHLNADRSDRLTPRAFGWWFLEGVAYVVVLTVCYVAAVPSTEKSSTGCGTLAKKEDPAGIFIPLGPSTATTSALAVLDPLCPACKGFEERLSASSVRDQLNVNLVLFPLDASCNWMIQKSLHPGACAVSEAMLCDRTRARSILGYAFDHHEELRQMASEDERRLRKHLEEKFPGTKGCLGSASAKSKLNKSLRWAVANALPVLTPQLFIGDRRVCDEDTDLGLEYTVATMLAQPRPTGRK